MPLVCCVPHTSCCPELLGTVGCGNVEGVVGKARPCSAVKFCWLFRPKFRWRRLGLRLSCGCCWYAIVGDRNRKGSLRSMSVSNSRSRTGSCWESTSVLRQRVRIEELSLSIVGLRADRLQHDFGQQRGRRTWTSVTGGGRRANGRETPNWKNASRPCSLHPPRPKLSLRMIHKGQRKSRASTRHVRESHVSSVPDFGLQKRFVSPFLFVESSKT